MSKRLYKGTENITIICHWIFYSCKYLLFTVYFLHFKIIATKNVIINSVFTNNILILNVLAFYRDFNQALWKWTEGVDRKKVRFEIISRAVSI